MLTNISIALFCTGVLLGLLALALGAFARPLPEGRIDIRQAGFIVKAVFILANGSGGLLGLSLIGFVVAGLWWLVTIIGEYLSPGRLALLSILLALLPLIVAFLGVGLAKLLGGHVDARGSRDCYLLGWDLNSLVYSLFMCYWGVFITGGLAVFGLMGSGLWAIFG